MKYTLDLTDKEGGLLFMAFMAAAPATLLPLVNAQALPGGPMADTAHSVATLTEKMGALAAKINRAWATQQAPSPEAGNA